MLRSDRVVKARDLFATAATAAVASSAGSTTIVMKDQGTCANGR
jgi:hypothetical protein